MGLAELAFFDPRKMFRADGSLNRRHPCPAHVPKSPDLVGAQVFVSRGLPERLSLFEKHMIVERLSTLD